MKSLRSLLPAPWALTAVSATFLLSACGGGGGGSSEPAAVTPPAVVKTTLSGTAATGAAMAGATISVKCVAGNGTATTAADGTFTVNMNDVTLPCVASATSADGKTVLHAVVNPAGSMTQTLNISPLTELIVAQIAGGAPAALFSAFDAAAAAKITPASITSALDTVVATLKAGGVDFSAIGNPMTATLVAKTTSTSGNAYDQALDLLGSKLTTAGSTLAQLTSAVTAPASSTTSVPPSQLLQPGHPSCAALRSGTFRWIVPGDNDPVWRTSKVQLDAPSLTLTWQDGSKSTPTALGGCAFSTNAGNTRIVVSPAGVVIATSADASGKQMLGIGFPEQAAQLADLAGTWNVVEFNNANNNGTTANPSFVNTFTVAELAADGRHLSLSECAGLSACVAKTGPFGTFRVNSAGGFDYVDTSGVASGMRFFTFRAASGDIALVGADSDGSVMVGSKQALRALPTVGSVTNRWDVSVSPSGVAGAFSEASYTVTSVDSAAQTFSRTTQSNGVVNVFANNKPRNGLVYRAPATTTSNTGASVSVSELISLSLPGTGVVVYGRITTDVNRSAGFFGVGVNKPDGAAGTTNWPAATGTGSTGGTGTAGPNLFVITGGESYPMRASITVNASGLITGGQYDTHKLDGTMTACSHSAANDATCHGTNASLNQTSQSGPITASGSATPITLTAGPDVFGFIYTGVLTGKTWSGTWTKVATTNSPTTMPGGSFSVDLTITVQ